MDWQCYSVYRTEVWSSRLNSCFLIHNTYRKIILLNARIENDTYSEINKKFHDNSFTEFKSFLEIVQ